jgi:hypothetical protein
MTARTGEADREKADFAFGTGTGTGTGGRYLPVRSRGTSNGTGPTFGQHGLGPRAVTRDR